MPSDGPTELRGSERFKGGIIVRVLRWPPADSPMAGGGGVPDPWEAGLNPLKYCGHSFRIGAAMAAEEVWKILSSKPWEGGGA